MTTQSSSFFGEFPELIHTEFRCIDILASHLHIIPEDKYYFEEYFCVRKECDCRNVKIKVINADGEVFATISYGWEPSSYYKNWGMDAKMAKQMSTPMLCAIGKQSEIANYFLIQFIKMIDSDKEYKERIKRHYFMFRMKICSEKPKLSLVKKIGRNDFCHCGSGKKYKKCCLNKK
jgi:hypothetical protein